MKLSKPTLKRPTWFDNRFALILAVIVLLIAAGARWNRPFPPGPGIPPNAAPDPALAGAVLPQMDETPSPDATPLQPSRTPYPPELLSNRQQTIGISLVAALLVLIVSGGVFSVFLRDRDAL